MDLKVVAQSIITIASLSTAIGAIVAIIIKIVHWFDRQKWQDTKIRDMQGELCLLTYGVLACLKGLKEQGCNGPVKEAIGKIEKSMNKKSHEIKEE